MDIHAAPHDALAMPHDREALLEQLAQRIKRRAIDSFCGNLANLSKEEILQHYHDRLVNNGFGSKDEIRWVIRRTASLLAWPAEPRR